MIRKKGLKGRKRRERRRASPMKRVSTTPVASGRVRMMVLKRATARKVPFWSQMFRRAFGQDKPRVNGRPGRRAIMASRWSHSPG
ncbi:MAG: hypothetical protein QW788_04330, partial [Candidatus Hadarchaeales archaeon]